MSNDQFEHIRRIREDFHEGSKRLKNSSNNSIKTLADDLYNKHTHFIFELIQNAEDNAYERGNTYQPYISFLLTKTDPIASVMSDGALIIQNNEIGFNADDVDAICAVGETTKEKEQGYIGEKGIGFKSVFRVTDNPHIFSNGYHFCLPEFDEETGLGYIVPQWIGDPPEGLDLSETYIILPLTKPDFGYDKIEEMLRDIEPEIILFLSTLQEIQIKTDTGDDFTILKDASAMPEVQIIAEGNKQGLVFSNSDSFLVCTERFDKPADIHHEKRDGIENRDVTIGFPMDENSTAVGKVFAYLPVRWDTGFPFLINADFILPSSREDIQDVPWNRCWLIDCIADLVARKLLPLLKEQKFLSVGFLEALAGKLNDLSKNENDLFYPVFSGLRETFINEELLPANDGTFVSAQNAKLDDSEGLIELLKPNQLSLLFKRSNVTKWLVPDITARRAQNLWKYLRMELKIDEVDPEMFARRIDKSFLEQQDDDWFIDFYKFLSVGKRPPRSLWTSASGILRSKPILRLQDNSLVKPDEPNVYLSKGTDSAITTRLIKIEISRNEDAHKFLRELDVPEWDIISEVIEHILPKYRDNPSLISSAEYNRDFSKIVNAYKTDSQKKKDQLREALMTTPFILQKKPDASDQIYLQPNTLCFGPDDGLWRNNSTGTYSRVSVSKEVRTFLQALDIPKWDIVDEVIETILPKYKRNPPPDSIKEHLKDLGKIIQAYRVESESYYFNREFQIKLETTSFIRPEGIPEHVPKYHKLNELYLETNELRLYSEGNDAYKFVSSIYPDEYVDVFKKLGISDKIRVDCASKPRRTDDVDLSKQDKYHRLGLKGFDPDIEVDGLKHALMNPSVEKSKVIWEHIAAPYSHCIKGKILLSSRQDFHHSARIRKEKDMTSDFGRLLIEKAWIPDANGNMRKPSEIMLAELPEEFVCDEQLANQLGMRKDGVTELADKWGVSEKDIKDYMQDREEFREWQAEKVKRTQQLPSEQEEIDLPVEIEKSFNKSGKTELQSHIIDDGRVKNPERRREKLLKIIAIG